MSKAEEFAVSRYPHDKYGGMIGDSIRRACMIGYHQAEKDHALSWQDAKRIVEIADRLLPYASVKHADLDHEFQSEEEYYKEILKRFNNGRKPAGERYMELLKISERVWGRKLTRNKTYEDTRIRMFVSYKMDKEGYSSTEIGKAMGRHHSSILNHVKRMHDVFDEPVFYAEENTKYELFDQYVRDHDGEREN